MDMSVTGARIYWTIPVLGGIPITETVVNTWIIILLVTGLCIFLTRGLKVHATSRRQVIAEFLVNTARKFVDGNMGGTFSYYTPFVASIFVLSAVSSLSSLVGAYAPTSDLSTLLGWALLVFVLITYTKVKTNGVLGYFKGYTQPVSYTHLDVYKRQGRGLPAKRIEQHAAGNHLKHAGDLPPGDEELVVCIRPTKAGEQDAEREKGGDGERHEVFELSPARIYKAQDAKRNLADEECEHDDLCRR